MSGDITGSFICEFVAIELSASAFGPIRGSVTGIAEGRRIEISRIRTSRGHGMYERMVDRRLYERRLMDIYCCSALNGAILPTGWADRRRDR